MKNIHIYSVPFNEHPVVEANKEPVHAFDLMLSNSIVGEEADFDFEGYCINLLDKLVSIPKNMLPAFLRYQCQQMKYPLIWLQSVKYLLDRNTENLVKMEMMNRLILLYDRLTEMEQEMEGFVISRKWTKLSGFVRKVEPDEFDIKQVKIHLSSLGTSQEKRAYLLRKRADYIQVYGYDQHSDQFSFVFQVNVELQLLDELAAMQSTSELEQQNKSFIRWYGNINALVKIFLDLKKSFTKSNEPLINPSPGELLQFLYSNFRRADGSLLSKETLKTYITPGKEDKLPKS